MFLSTVILVSFLILLSGISTYLDFVTSASFSYAISPDGGDSEPCSPVGAGITAGISFASSLGVRIAPIGTYSAEIKTFPDLQFSRETHLLTTLVSLVIS